MTQISDTGSLLVQDPMDLRDRYFTPSLRPLAPDSIETLVARICPKTGSLPYHVRDQGDAGTCAGQALANLIDLQRIQAAGSGGDRPAKVSARMLYRMGVLQERGPEGHAVEGVRSLRSVIKGFYHNGVCSDDLWPDQPGETELTPERAIAARQTTLGAYYRVRPYLNDYHAALSEAECILVSAEIHDGWDPRSIVDGEIPIRPGSRGSHAFVIVGYNDRGFLVLNSHGPKWGRYRREPHTLGGIALWTYDDWADQVMDAWVLRLGVPSPEAFQYSTTRRGIIFGDDPIRAGSTPGHQLIGHFAHLDDGRHVRGGSYASTRQSVVRTAERIAARPARPVLLTLPGSLLGMRDAFAVEVNRRPGIEQLGMYPYTVFWCNDMVESTSAVLEHLFGTAVAKVGAHDIALNATIEDKTSGIGRAFWRDVKRAARLSARHRPEARPPRDPSEANRGPDGAAAALFDAFAGTGARLHVVADGAGVLLLEQYLLSLEAVEGGEPARRRRAAFFKAVASITLIAPAIEAAPFVEAFGPILRALSDKGPNRATLWSPTSGFERRLAVGPYTRSILHLVLYGFEGAGDQRSYIGMSAKRSGIRAMTAPGQPLEGLRIRKIRRPDRKRQPADKRRRRYHQTHVVLNEDAYGRMLAQLVGINLEDEAKGTDR